MITLLKIDSADKIRVINLWTWNNMFCRTAGIYGGTLVLTESPCTGKNIGRSNETTPEAQAVLEMNSTVAEKLNEGYVNTNEWFTDLSTLSTSELKAKIQANATKAPQAMLAKVYDKKYADYANGVLCSPKLDGMRCMAVIPAEGEIILWSRGGKKIDTMPHIIADCEVLRNDGFVGILDGELYIHDKDADNFQDVMKAIKKYRKGISELVKYWVYDIIIDKHRANDRFLDYAAVITNSRVGNICPLPQIEVYSEVDIMEIHKNFLEQGYEGTMLKNAYSMYQPDKRSSDLLKLKNFDDAEFRVVGILPMDRKPECGVALCALDGDKDPRTFKATPKMSYEHRKELLDNNHQYIGGMATVSFFGRTADGFPRFPVLKTITKPGDLEDFRTK
jgi:ATP-dependent DNA ligase